MSEPLMTNDLELALAERDAARADAEQWWQLADEAAAIIRTMHGPVCNGRGADCAWLVKYDAALAAREAGR